MAPHNARIDAPPAMPDAGQGRRRSVLWISRHAPAIYGIWTTLRGMVEDTRARRATAMRDKGKALTEASPGEVEAFLDRLKEAPPRSEAGRGRLIFALDATASRQPTWDRAARLQAEMFHAASAVGSLEIQLCFYRGFGEFRVSPWLARAGDLVRMMTTVDCRAGETQIGKVLQHVVNVALEQKVGALVFVGDCIEESIDAIAGRAGQMGAQGVPAFMFHEGRDARAAFAFKEIARLSGGAYCRFDADSADTLRRLLCAVAVFAAGGRPALRRLAAAGGEEVRHLIHQLGDR